MFQNKVAKIGIVTACMHTQVPSNSGLIFLQQVIPPSLVYWPKATSRKKTGMPQVKRKIRYGMRNAPEGRKMEACVCSLVRLMVAVVFWSFWRLLVSPLCCNVKYYFHQDEKN